MQNDSQHNQLSQYNQIIELFLQGNTVVLFTTNHKTCICKNKYTTLDDFKALLYDANKARVI